MTLSIRVATGPGEAQVAVTENAHLLDFALWRPGSPDGVGDVHRGRVIAHVPAMAGAFVALVDAEGFLPDSEGAKGLTVGTMLTVHVTRAAIGEKGPRLSAKGEDAADSGPVRRLRRGPDALSRLAARYPDAPIVVDDAGVAAGVAARPALATRVSVSKEDVFDEAVAEAIDALSRPIVTLPNGGRLSIWPTPALVAIDVDAGSALAGAGVRHEAVNRAAVRAVAEQIRLRNLSGGIVVDLAGLSPRKRAGFAPDFSSALADDALRPKFLGFTALGLAEIVRPRVHPPLHELLAGPLAAGLAAIRTVMMTFAQESRGLAAVRAHPDVVSALRADTACLPDLARRTGRTLSLRSDPSLPPMAWMLEEDNG